MRRTPSKVEPPAEPPTVSCSSCKRRMTLVAAEPIIFTKLVDMIYECGRCGKRAKRLVQGK